MKPKATPKRRNYVAKNMEKFHKPKTYRCRKRQLMDKETKRELKDYERY